MKKFNLLALLIVMLFPLIAEGPVSREAKVINENRNGEIELRATGIYNSPAPTKEERQADVNQNGIAQATEDAKKAAIYTILFEEPAQILNTDNLRRNFEYNGAFVYEKANIDRYIMFVDKNLPNTTSLDDGQGVQITTTIIVNGNTLLLDLMKMGLLEDTPPKATDNRAVETKIELNQQEQKPTSRGLNRETVLAATMKAIADIPERSVVALTDVTGDIFIDNEALDLPDLIIDVIIELKLKTVDPGRLRQIVEENEFPEQLDVTGQLDLGRAAGAGYIINVTATESSLRIQCINVETGIIEGRGTVDL